MILNKVQEAELRDHVVSQLSQYSFAQRQAIAEQAGVHYNTIHYWVTGRYAPKIDMALKVKEVLDGLATTARRDADVPDTHDGLPAD